MAEEIKVVMEADASQLTAEFKKAQASAEGFAKKTLPMTEAGLQSVWVQQQKVAKGMAQGKREVAGYSGGLLQLAQTADDAQYGLRGVLNNIPGLVMGLGGGAGLAGVLSLVTLGVAKLAPELEKLFKAEDPKAFQDYLDKLAKARGLASDLAAARGKAAANQFIRSLTDEEAALQDHNVALARNVELLRLRKDLESDFATARDEVARRQIEMAPGRSREEKINALARLEEAAAKRRADQSAAKLRRPFEDASQKAQEAAAADQRAREVVRRAREELQARQREMRDITARKSAGELAAASLPGARQRLALMERGINPGDVEVSGGPQQSALKFLKALEEAREHVSKLETDAVAGGSLAKKDGDLRGRIETLKAGLAEMEEKQQGLAESARDAAAARDHEQRSMQEKLAALKKITEQEKRARQLDVQAQHEVRKNDELSEKKAQQDRLKSDGTKTTKIGQREEKKLERDAEEEELREGAKRDLAVDLKVARLRATGQHQMADALEREQQLRREAVMWAERTGMAEDKTLKIVRERQRLLDQAARGPGTQDSRIRVASADRIGGGPLASMTGNVARARGLRGNTARRINEERRPADTTATSAAASYYERSLGVLDRVAKAVEGLGAG